MDYLKIGANDSFSGFIIGRKVNNGTVLNVNPFFFANVKNTSSAMECSGIINLNPASPKNHATTPGFLYPDFMIQGMPMPYVFVDLEFLTDTSPRFQQMLEIGWR